MSIDYKDIISVLNISKNGKGCIERLVIDYGILKHKLDNPDEQSWYFKNSLQSSKKKLIKLREEFNEIRKEFNKSSFDILLAKLNDAKACKKGLLSKSYMNTIDFIMLSSYQSSIDYYKELITFKSRVDIIKRINIYIKNKDELLKLLNW